MLLRCFGGARGVGRDAEAGKRERGRCYGFLEGDGCVYLEVHGRYVEEGRKRGCRLEGFRGHE